MNAKVILFVALIFTGTNCLAQEENETDITNITKVTFLSPGASYEKRIAKFQSLFVRGSMIPSGYVAFGGALGNSSAFYLDPALTLHYRYYYNFAKRENKEKRTAWNCLNYIAAIWETVFSKKRITSSHYVDDNLRAINTVGLAWGLQRNYKRRFSLDLDLGLGYLFTKLSKPNDLGQTITVHIGQLEPIININLGFWLNKRE